MMFLNKKVYYSYIHIENNLNRLIKEEEDKINNLIDNIQKKKSINDTSKYIIKEASKKINEKLSTKTTNYILNKKETENRI